MKIAINLLGVKPAVRRIVVINPKKSFHHLHYIIQLSMGWENEHLYQFITSSRQFIGEISLMKKAGLIDARKITIEEFLREKGDAIQYEYDFGDGWLHEIKVLSNEKDNIKSLFSYCIEGEMNCPPEDCGGIWGYEELKKIMEKPRSKRAKEKIEWLGYKYDPHEFDLDQINEDLRDIHQFIKHSFYEYED